MHLGVRADRTFQKGDTACTPQRIARSFQSRLSKPGCPQRSHLHAKPGHVQVRKRTIKVAAEKKEGRPGDFVKVKFLLPNCFVNFNERLRVVGSGSLTGLWTAEAVPEKEWQQGGYWTAEVYLPPGRYAFKVTTIRADGTVDWEKGKSREFEVPKNINETLLQTIPSTTLGDRRPLQINLERWFDVDALISGLEGKRRSLHDSISELQGIIQTGNGMSPSTSKEDKPKDEEKKKGKWGSLLSEQDDKDEGKKKDDKGKGSSGGGRTWSNPPDMDAVTAYTKRMKAAEDEYMAKVWKDLVTEVVRTPGGSGGGAKGSPALSPARAPGDKSSKTEDLGLGVTSLRVNNPVGGMGHAPALQLLFPETSLRPLRPRPWLFNPLTSTYERAPAVEEQLEDALPLLQHAVEHLKASHALPTADGAAQPPKQPPAGRKRPKVPLPGDFLLIDTDSIPLGMELPTLEDLVSSVQEPQEPLASAPVFQDTDSAALLDVASLEPSPFLGVDAVLQSMQTPFARMDFNEAFRLASSSFPRPVQPPDDYLDEDDDDALDHAVAPMQPVTRQQRTVQPCQNSAQLIGSAQQAQPSMHAAAQGMDRAQTGQVVGMERPDNQPSQTGATSAVEVHGAASSAQWVAAGLWPVASSLPGLQEGFMSTAAGPSCPLQSAAAAAALGALQGVANWMGTGEGSAADSSVDKSSVAPAGGVVMWVEEAEDREGTQLEWIAPEEDDAAEEGEDLLEPDMQSSDMSKVLGQISSQLQQLSSKVDRLTPAVLADAGAVQVLEAPAAPPGGSSTDNQVQSPAVDEHCKQESSGAGAQEATLHGTMPAGVDSAASCIRRVPAGGTAGSYEDPEAVAVVDEPADSMSAQDLMSFDTWAQQQATLQRVTEPGAAVPSLFNSLADAANNAGGLRSSMAGLDGNTGVVSQTAAGTVSSATLASSSFTGFAATTAVQETQLLAPSALLHPIMAGVPGPATAATQAATASVAATAVMAGQLLSSAVGANRGGTSASIRQFVNGDDAVELYLSCSQAAPVGSSGRGAASGMQALKSMLGQCWESLVNLGHRDEGRELQCTSDSNTHNGAASQGVQALHTTQTAGVGDGSLQERAGSEQVENLAVLDVAVMETLVQQAVKPLL